MAASVEVGLDVVGAADEAVSGSREQSSQGGAAEETCLDDEVIILDPSEPEEVEEGVEIVCVRKKKRRRPEMEAGAAAAGTAAEEGDPANPVPLDFSASSSSLPGECEVVDLTADDSEEAEAGSGSQQALPKRPRLATPAELAMEAFARAASYVLQRLRGGLAGAPSGLSSSGLARSGSKAAVIDVEAEEEEEEEKKPPPPVRIQCPVCLGDTKETTTTHCGHIFCRECIVMTITNLGRCPACRRELTLDQIHRVYI